MIRTSRKTLGWLLACLLAGAETRADRLELQTGDIFTGKILRVNDHEASIQLESGGILSFSLSGVRSIRRSSKIGEESQVIFERDGHARKPLPEDEAPAPFPLAAPLPSDGKSPAVPSRPKQPAPGLPAAGGGPPRPGGIALRNFGKGGDPSEDTISLKGLGFSVAPPAGFAAWPEAQSTNVPLAFRDPFTLTSFTAATYPSADPIDKIKKSALRSYAEQFRIFHVLRDEELRKTEGEPQAWLVEMESRIGTVAIHQIQVFTRTRASTIVLTYSSTQENYPKFQAAFEKSLASFHFEAEEKPTSTASRATQQGSPDILKEKDPPES